MLCSCLKAVALFRLLLLGGLLAEMVFEKYGGTLYGKWFDIGEPV
jgi:hypothetical protein